MAAVRGILRWLLPWYASGSEVVHPFDTSRTPASRYLVIPARINTIVPAQIPRTFIPERIINTIVAEDIQ